MPNTQGVIFIVQIPPPFFLKKDTLCPLTLPQAQDTLSTTSPADAAAVAAKARRWLQIQNAGRSSGEESVRKGKLFVSLITENSFSQTAQMMSASTRARMAGKSTMGTATT